VLVRNHEMVPGNTPKVSGSLFLEEKPAELPNGLTAEPGGALAGVRAIDDVSDLYDPLGTGGTTTLWVDAERKLVRSFASLAGTFRNCAGGATPWGTWLSAEECTYMPGPLDPGSHDQRPDVSKKHGYVFEVDARAQSLVPPKPILAMGRFYHEALAVDPATGFVYLTEDRTDGLLYRYRPEVVTSGAKAPHQLVPGDLARGGALEALRIAKVPAAKTQNWDASGKPFAVGHRYAVDWVAIPDREPDVDMARDPSDLEHDPLERKEKTAPGSVRAQGFRLGAAQFARNEGITYHAGSLYFCATNGGSAKAGQVWRLELQHHALSLVVEPNDRVFVDGPDNLTPAPNGDLVVCEDGRDDNYVFGLTPQGRIYRLARNAYNQSEFAGACFSPDGATLFVNVQDPGQTFAIWGPWDRRIA
jgi:secreted PhoX family phosphatase